MFIMRIRILYYRISYYIISDYTILDDIILYHTIHPSFWESTCLAASYNKIGSSQISETAALFFQEISYGPYGPANSLKFAELWAPHVEGLQWCHSGFIRIPNWGPIGSHLEFYSYSSGEMILRCQAQQPNDLLSRIVCIPGLSLNGYSTGPDIMLHTILQVAFGMFHILGTLT